MIKKIVPVLVLLAALNSMYVCAAGIDKLPPINSSNNNKLQPKIDGKNAALELDQNTVYYPNANIKSVVAKYKSGNYSGCLQELFSLVQKDPSNALAYYYMAMAYTHIDMQESAVEAYEKVIALQPNSYLADYTEKGRDCLIGGPACIDSVENVPQEELTELDKFINAPYGDGLAPELSDQVKQKELTNIRETINKKEELENHDIQKIKHFDQKHSDQSSYAENDKIAQVSDEEILNAIKTLKDAGVNVTVQSDNPYAQMVQYQDPKMAEMSMLLGNNNNNSNNMMNMLPMLMSQAKKGENIDPRVMQAIMMNSMMPDFGLTNNNDNY